LHGFLGGGAFGSAASYLWRAEQLPERGSILSDWTNISPRSISVDVSHIIFLLKTMLARLSYSNQPAASPVPFVIDQRNINRRAITGQCDCHVSAVYVRATRASFSVLPSTCAVIFNAMRPC